MLVYSSLSFASVLSTRPTLTKTLITGISSTKTPAELIGYGARLLVRDMDRVLKLQEHALRVAVTFPDETKPPTHLTGMTRARASRRHLS